jgi:hypothetical protein
LGVEKSADHKVSVYKSKREAIISVIMANLVRDVKFASLLQTSTHQHTRAPSFMGGQVTGSRNRETSREKENGQAGFEIGSLRGYFLGFGRAFFNGRVSGFSGAFDSGRPAWRIPTRFGEIARKEWARHLTYRVKRQVKLKYKRVIAA